MLVISIEIGWLCLPIVTLMGSLIRLERGRPNLRTIVNLNYL